MTAPTDRIDTRIPGITLIASGVMALAVMAHHPTAGGGDCNTFTRNVERVAALNQAVHGTLLVLIVVITWALIVFVTRRGFDRPLMTLGLCAWVIGTAGMFVAGIFNGFVIIQIARLASASPEIRDMLRVALRVFGSGVGVIEMVGAIGMSAAVVLWSTDLTLDNGMTRQAGVAGIVAGAVLVTALASGIVHLDVHGMMLLLSLWTLWFSGLGALMILRRV